MATERSMMLPRIYIYIYFYRLLGVSKKGGRKYVSYLIPVISYTFYEPYSKKQANSKSCLLVAADRQNMFIFCSCCCIIEGKYLHLSITRQRFASPLVGVHQRLGRSKHLVARKAHAEY